MFYRDTLNNLFVSKDQVLFDLQQTKLFYKYCKTNDYYNIFLHIILSLLLEEEIVLLDNDFTNEELKSLIGTDTIEKFTTEVPKNALTNLKCFEDVILKAKRNGKKSIITLFTSGTTGLPKKVSHTFSNLTRFVKTSDKHKKAIWGFAYHPTHIAGLQVFFQAFLNQNSIIRLFQLPPEQIVSEIKKNNITHLSATPTFYRMLLGQTEQMFSVERLTFGGEKFDNLANKNLSWLFPNAKITNIYASTEAGTIFASEGNEFTIKTGMEQNVKIIDNELYIHKDYIGKSDTLSLKDGWYQTGDLVEILDQNPLRFSFLSRKNEMINVGGYKVNPTEIEEQIRKISGVRETKVFSKKNSVLGNIVGCEIAVEESYNGRLNEKFIRNELKTKLQDYKIPRIIKFVKSIEQTRTGKIKR